MNTLVLCLCFLISLCIAQLPGNLQPEVHPSLTYQQCTKANGCQNVQGSIVLDSNWRWTHLNSVVANCYTGNLWNTSVCTDPVTCAQSCVIEGVNYEQTYGITTNGDSLRMNFVTVGPYDTNVGGRVYLMSDNTHYQMFNLMNKEFTFDVDVSQLPCGLNGALYFVEMAADGGMSQFPTNKAGAQYGTGYCDAQCPRDLKWIDGVANLINWTPSKDDPNSGTGQYGNCCHEMDIWEANTMDTAYTAHVCKMNGQLRCNGTSGSNSCGDVIKNRYVGPCDRDGCDFNSYRNGNLSFFGPGGANTIDSTQPVTVTTQFLTDPTGQTLREIRRFYIQNGKVVQNSYSTFPSLTTFNSLSDQYCTASKKLFQDTNTFSKMGGMRNMGSSLSNGMVLVMSLWDDFEEHMLWLDSLYPPTGNPGKPGVLRGNCSITSGVPKEVQSQYPNAYVTYSNIKFGDIGSTTDIKL